MCQLHSSYCAMCSINRKICKYEEYLFPVLYVTSPRKMKTINMGRKTLPIKINVTMMQFKRNALEKS